MSKVSVPRRIYKGVDVAAALKIEQLVFNQFRVRVFRLMSAESQELYNIYYDKLDNQGKSLKYSDEVAIAHFIAGVVACMKSF